MVRRSLIICVLLITSSLVACQDQSQSSASKQETVVVAKLQKPVQRLYYSGILKPIRMHSILSPVSGSVIKIDFSYGQFVSNGQPLLSIDSNDLAENYRKSIAEYLQKKNTYTNSSEDFRGSDALYKAGVISRQEFITSRSQYRNNQLSYYQSQYGMEKILMKAGINPRDVEGLTLEDATKISNILQRQFKKIVINSTAKGIALFPIRSEGTSNDNNENKEVELGSSVKEGQLLLTVGDLNGLSLQIHVNEININRLHKGMKAIVTGNAFPNMKLNAYIASVSSQAKGAQSNSALSEFPVMIKVPSLTATQRKVIRVGMTAKVAIVVQQEESILLPVAAVYTKNGQSMVTVKKGRHRQAVPVEIGFTTTTDASIVSGIKPGDKVVVPQTE